MIEGRRGFVGEARPTNAHATGKTDGGPQRHSPPTGHESPAGVRQITENGTVGETGRGRY